MTTLAPLTNPFSSLLPKTTLAAPKKLNDPLNLLTAMPGGSTLGMKTSTPAIAAPRPAVPVVAAAAPKPAVAPMPAPAVARPVIPAVPKVAPNVTTPSGAVVNPSTGGLVTPAPTTPVAPTVPPVDQNYTTASVPPAPATPSAPAQPSAYETAVSNAEKEYQKNIAITPEEQAAQEELDKLQQSYKSGYLDIEGRTIPLQFITGQQAALEKRSLSLAEPLETKLARLQAQRQSALEASKFALDRADKTRENSTKATEVGGNLVRLNPATGQYETVYNAPAKPAEGFTLGQGQQRYDASGKLLASGAPETPSISEKYGTGVVGEYNFYADQERKAGRQPMDFNAYQNLDANRKAKAAGGTGGGADGKLLTVTEAQALGVPYGTTRSEAFGLDPAKAASGDAAKLSGIVNTIGSDLDALQTKLTGLGRSGIAAALAGTDPELSRLIDNVADKVGRLRSGGAINKDEAANFKSQLIRGGDLLAGNTNGALSAIARVRQEAAEVSSKLQTPAQKRAAAAPAPAAGGASGKTSSGLGYTIIP